VRSFDGKLRVNERITAPKVRVIDSDDRMLGVLPIADALRAADGRQLDLVEVSPKMDPPVCKILDFKNYSERFPELIREVEFVAHIEHHSDVRSGFKIDKGWCVLVFQRPDQVVAKSDYMSEAKARELGKKLNAQFRK
jgi:hypothetical protein